MNDLLNTTKAADGRIPLNLIYQKFDELEENGWIKKNITNQTLVIEDNEFILPVPAFFNSSEVDYVLIAGIHGREPAGVNALFNYIDTIIELGKTKNILVLPILNPWGYYNHIRYGVEGQSVSDSDHLFNRAEKPACRECDEITKFVLKDIAVNENAKVLDLHEDPVYEAPNYIFDGYGSYLYAAGENAGEKEEVKRIADYLRNSKLPLINSGVTRFDEKLTNGMIVNSADGSIDELLAVKCKASPVITVENLLHAESDPDLSLRVETYIGILNAFFDIPKCMCFKKNHRKI